MSHYSPIVATLASLISLAIILSSGFGKKIQDIPNERSLHSVPIPRIGGVGMMAGVLSGWALMAGVLAWWLILPLTLLFVVSLFDDMRGLPVRQRLFAQLVAAAILVGGSGLFAQQGVAVALALLLLTVWMTNLYNFMDGSDGLAGGMALFGFASYGLAALIAHDDIFAMLNFSIAAAALGFLYHNFPPAKVFMGDAGSIPLGFLAAAMGILGWQQGDWAAWFPLLVFSPFIIDTSVTLVKRSLRGVKITEAHREHYYQRAIQMGVRHRDVAIFEYALMLFGGGLALWFRESMFPWRALLACACVYIFCMYQVDSRWEKINRESE